MTDIPEHIRIQAAARGLSLNSAGQWADKDGQVYTAIQDEAPAMLGMKIAPAVAFIPTKGGAGRPPLGAAETVLANCSGKIVLAPDAAENCTHPSAPYAAIFNNGLADIDLAKMAVEKGLVVDLDGFHALPAEDRAAIMAGLKEIIDRAAALAAS